MFYPINLKLEDIEITVIGGGEVAYRKCKNFLGFGKSVKVVSEKFIEKFSTLESKLEIINDSYKEEYIKSSFIVVAATNNKEVNKKIGIYCRNNGKLVNVVDDIELSNYTVPSCVKRGELLISISTGGNSPSLSAKIKRELENKYDNTYDEYVSLLGEIRKEIIEKIEDISERKNKLNALVNLDIDELKVIKTEYENIK